MTGLRRGEILDLQPADFDSKIGVITIQSSDANRVRGGKTRKIPLQQEAIEIISDVPGVSQWIFTDGMGNRIAEGPATRKFKKYTKDAGLSGDIHFHSLRHAFATMASNEGMTPNILKAITGHSSIKTTEGYIDSDIDTMREQMKKVSVKEEVPRGKEIDNHAAQSLAENK